MKHLRLQIFVLLVCTVFSCRQDAPAPPSYTIPMSPALKVYGFFLPGTYWVYEDSLSKALDSVFVVSAIQGTNRVTAGQNRGYTGSFGWLNEQWNSSRDGSVHILSVDMAWSINASSAILWDDKSLNGVSVGHNILMTDNFNPGYTIYPPAEPQGSLVLEQVYDTLKVLGLSYPHVICVYDKHDITQGNGRTTLYLAPNKGLIRKELPDSNKVWNLKRFKIVQ